MKWLLKTLLLIAIGLALMLGALVVSFLEDPLTGPRLAVALVIYVAGAVVLVCAIYRIWDRLFRQWSPVDEIN